MDRNKVINNLLKCDIQNSAVKAQFLNLGFKFEREDEISFEEAVVCAQITQAMRGDQKSYEQLMKDSKNDGLMPLEEFVRGNVKEDK